MYKYKKRVGISFILAMAIVLGVTPNVNALSNQKSANKACLCFTCLYFKFLFINALADNATA